MGDAQAVSWLPVVYRPGEADAPIFDPSVGPALSTLLVDMNGAVERRMGPPLSNGGQVSAVTHALTAHPPNVQFGCPPEASDPEECAIDRATPLGRDPTQMLLTVGRPSSEWIAWVAESLANSGVDHVLVLSLEVGQYLPKQVGWRGHKIVELGTDYVVDLPWLTSLEAPVRVLQLTGAVVTADGRSIRIGAEGLMVRRTRLSISALGGQELLDDEDVAALREATRDDLPGRPLVWEVGLQNLLNGLIGDAGLVAGRPLRAKAGQGTPNPNLGPPSPAWFSSSEPTWFPGFAGDSRIRPEPMLPLNGGLVAVDIPRRTWVGAAVGFAVGGVATWLYLHQGGSTSRCDRDANQDAWTARECAAVTVGGGVVAGLVGGLGGHWVAR